MAHRIPAELWQQIFTYTALGQDDSYGWTHFWLAGRSVCKSWRSNMAQTYLDVFLRQPKRTVITFDYGWGRVRSDRNRDQRCKFVVSMLYHDLDPSDRSRIVFKACDEINDAAELDLDDLEFDDDVEYDKTEVEGEYRQKNQDKWRKSLVDYTKSTHSEEYIRPPYVISIYGATLDSELPELSYDLERQEISFNWEAMLDAFCAESAELDRRNKATVQRIAADAQSTPQTDGDMDPWAQAMVKTMAVVKKATTENLKWVRRARIKKSYKEVHGFDCLMDWNFVYEEKLQLEKIQAWAHLGRDEDCRDGEGDGDMVGEDFGEEFDFEDDESDSLEEESRVEA